MNNKEKEQEIRTSWKMRTLGTLVGWVMRSVAVTLRMEVVDRCGFIDRARNRSPRIWCIWHSRIAGTLMSRNRIFPWRKGVVLTSASHDGAALAGVARVMGLEAVRGSSSRRGSEALREMVQAVRKGLDVAVTPDGPRGPRYRLGPGLIKLAQVTRAPVMGVHVHYSRAIRLKTWDRFVVPLPFSKLTIIFDELLDVPRKLDDDAFESKRVEAENMMRAGVDDLDLPTYDHSQRKRNRR
ncbi:MAG: hypothetical protein CMN05_15035 [Roseibacillus sp.]|jgi:hypothetical protein|nr:hypothetical protein [Roseibacillus sp.]MBP36265.1 hypothetical protein [Roseibacillus sp.]MCP4729844.1 lysophospholipid acyltransferase family protein [Roseibacillus sp.]MDP7306628.1 lysophospholipid acyltransferase family protein [Roseibacillus sp.]MDP7657296.1 lysophospholipid acyltransferase family protein [Roseibacillus sp.]|tara:strand:+ start:1469 stop:2185 length:717 start_codon:yes stop_codon:yes gene_type:complete